MLRHQAIRHRNLERWSAYPPILSMKATLRLGRPVPSILIAPFTGDRGDIAVNIKWSEGKWTTGSTGRADLTHQFAREPSVVSRNCGHCAENYVLGMSTVRIILFWAAYIMPMVMALSLLVFFIVHSRSYILAMGSPMQAEQRNRVQ
jgi:hypothetical protein